MVWRGMEDGERVWLKEGEEEDPVLEERSGKGKGNEGGEKLRYRGEDLGRGKFRFVWRLKGVTPGSKGGGHFCHSDCGW